jgi:hypothetical protein
MTNRRRQLLLSLAVATLVVACAGPVAQEAALEHAIYLPTVMSNYTPPAYSPKKAVANTYGRCDVVKEVGGQMQYGWGLRPKACEGVENIPMIWGREQWLAAMTGAELGGNSDYLLGFNEPDIGEQAGLHPYEAAVMWRQIEHKFWDYILISPAPSHLDPEWLERFRNAYITMYDEPPRLDGLAAHCYADAGFCKGTVQKYINWCNEWEGCEEVWVTEFAWWEGDWRGEMDNFIGWMEAEPTVTAYFWFASLVKGSERWGGGFEHASLADVDGNLTDKGRYYREIGE